MKIIPFRLWYDLLCMATNIHIHKYASLDNYNQMFFTSLNIIYKFIIGHFHITGWTNRYRTNKSSQTNKSSDVQTGQTNFSMNKLSDICLSGKMIFPRRFGRGDQQVNDSTT